jgi:hypothetical protein
MFLWTHAFGTETAAMRASNVGFFAIANLALVWPFRSQRLIALAVLTTACLSAPIWYYLNEIRPYIMLYMGAALIISGAIELLRPVPRPSALAIGMLSAGAVVMSGASVLGIAWAASTALFVLLYWVAIKKGSWIELLRVNWIALGLSALCIGVLLTHDVSKFLEGNRPILLYESNLQTIMFSFYANAGLLGAGPGMLDLRANGAAALSAFVPILALCSLVIGMVTIGGFLEIRKRLGGPAFLLMLGCILLPALFTFVLGFVLHWRVVARHLIPIVPLFGLLYAFGLVWWWRPPRIGRMVVLAFVVAMSYSSLSVRLAARHGKDDYQHAANLAVLELARGGRVWWVANWLGAKYYGVPISDQNERGDTALIVTPTTIGVLSGQAPPTLVLLSKPDAHDQTGEVGSFLARNNYRRVESFAAFTAWRPRR